MTENNGFDPSNVKKYYGKIFVTESGSHYGLTKDGKFTGRVSIEGAEIMLIAGIESKLHYSIVDCLDTSDPELKIKLDNLIREHGKEPVKGLDLVVSLAPKSVKQKNRYGLITSTIVSVE